MCNNGRTRGSLAPVAPRLPHLSNITIQVLPFSVGAHIAMLGPFVLLSFPQQGDADVVYLETDTSSLYLEQTQEIARYAEISDHLRATALSPRESFAFLGRDGR